MKKHLVIATLFAAVSAQAQEKTVDFFIQASPLFSYNHYKTTGIGISSMKSSDFTLGFGLEVVLPISEQVQLVPFLKYNNLRQSIETGGVIQQPNMTARFNSSIDDRYMQWNQGVLARMTLMEDAGAKWHLLGGLGYAMISRTSTSSGGGMSLSSRGPQGTPFPAVEMNVSSNQMDEDMSIGYFNIAAGTRFQFNIKKLGDFQIGTMFYVPLGNMPETHFTSHTTLNGVSYISETFTTNRKYNVELTIGYKIFGLKLK